MQTYEQFLAKSQEPLVIFNGKNSVVFCNESACRYFKKAGKNIFIKNIFPLDGGSSVVYLGDSELQINSKIVHQLRAPLTSLKWSVELLQENGVPDSQRKELFKNISNAVDYLIKSVNDLLFVSRISGAGGLSARNSLSDIKKLISNSINLLEQTAAAKKQTIILREKYKLAETFIDPDIFSSIFQNLLDNAINYGNENSEIDISVSSDLIRQMYIIAVKDYGISIIDEDREKIFSQFYRSSAAKKVKPAGTGLGLFIAKSSAEASGGNIWFESESDGATTFYFTVPIRGDARQNT